MKDKSYPSFSELPELQEWKECRASIGRFDESITSIRKYGFTLVTLLLSADGLIYSKMFSGTNPKTGPIVGVYLALMLLIFGLFRVDRFHEIFLRAAVERAKTLEDKIGMKLSQQIALYSRRCKTATWGHWLYVSFCCANWFLVLGISLDFSSWAEFFNSITTIDLLKTISTIILVLTAGLILTFHYRSRSKMEMLAAWK
jgi:hypothetical protein